MENKGLDIKIKFGPCGIGWGMRSLVCLCWMEVILSYVHGMWCSYMLKGAFLVKFKPGLHACYTNTPL